MSAESAQLKRKLKPGHLIYTLISEHEMILGFLADLAKLNFSIQKMKNYDGEKEVFKKLKDVAEHLAEAEPHHQREEKVLFPELEKKGVIGPPELMRQEHKELRAQKKILEKISKNTKKMEFKDFKRQLGDSSNLITLTLRNHIDKEDSILYPIALEVIEEGSWPRMKKECDKIGYCCFTP